MSEAWHVIYVEDDCGDFAPAKHYLAIGPHEDDTADTFAFSGDFRPDVPTDVARKFALLAAAPELLAACNRVMACVLSMTRDLSFLGPQMEETGVISDVRAAISKAEGE
jgi:hypothetical protein